MSPDTPIPFESLAKSEGPMPPGLSEGEVMVFQSIALLAARYRLGRISPEDSKREMNQIRQAYAKVKDMDKYAKYLANFRNSTCWALMKYGTNRTLENAEIMWRAFSGLEIYDPERENNKEATTTSENDATAENLR